MTPEDFERRLRELTREALNDGLRTEDAATTLCRVGADMLMAYIMTAPAGEPNP